MVLGTVGRERCHYLDGDGTFAGGVQGLARKTAPCTAVVVTPATSDVCYVTTYNTIVVVAGGL